MRFGSSLAVFLVALSSSTIGAAADLSSGKAVPPRSAPCLLSPQELQPAFEVTFETGVVKQEDPGVTSCTYKVSGSDDSVVITVDSTNDPDRFARKKKKRMMMRGETHNIAGIGDSAFSAGNIFSALKGNTSIEIRGINNPLSTRSFKFEDGIELLRMAVDRIK